MGASGVQHGIGDRAEASTPIRNCGQAQSFTIVPPVQYGNRNLIICCSVARAHAVEMSSACPGIKNAKPAPGGGVLVIFWENFEVFASSGLCGRHSGLVKPHQGVSGDGSGTTEAKAQTR